MTYAELAEAASRAARALIASGIEPGDRVSIWAPNATEWAIAALGVHTAGAVLVPLNTRFKAAEAAYILDRADVKLLFTVTDFLATNYVELLRAVDPPQSLREIVVLRGEPADATVSWADFNARADQATAGSVEERENALHGDDL